MSPQKKIGFFISLFVITLTLNAQGKFANGRYYFTSELNDFADVKIYEITNGKIKHLNLNEAEEFESLSISQGSDYVETSLINRNNALATWMNTCDDCAWTETQTTNAFYLGNPFIYIADHHRSVNNNTGEDCFGDEKCFEVFTNGYFRPVPTHIFDDVKVGGKSSNENNITKVNLTSQATELVVKIAVQNGTLHGPGKDHSYAIYANGKEYKLIGQYGWGGSDDGGFGSFTSDEEEVKTIILFFEPVPVNELMAGFNLKEGNCDAGCWNFYDVKLN
jgi:hypothetical protein